MLIVKLIKVKLFWILPFIVGVGAAKKLMLKVILFLFPALAHIFKLCSYYHKNYKDGTKYHQHNHQINHLHSVRIVNYRVNRRVWSTLYVHIVCVCVCVH